MGQIVGTPAFLAPESALGEQAIDHRADIYALGCVAYWMLTGTHVFAESTVIGMALAHITKVPLRPSERTDRAILPELDSLVLSCLEKDPTRRPSSAEALRLALAALPISEPWTRERALAWWRAHLPEPLPGRAA
jgi:serine/threonine-protein kinase